MTTNNKNELIQFGNDNKPRTGEEKKRMIDEAAQHYGKFLTSLGFHWEDDPNMKKTPYRVAKSWVEDLISGCLNPEPVITDFPSKYTGIVFEGDVEVNSMCAHHNLSFIGKAYVAYIPGERQIGLSKINRIVDWYSRRPQIQEDLTQQIHDHINKVCIGNKGVAVCIRANHMCCAQRGIKHDSFMVTSSLSGTFQDNNDRSRDEFLQFIQFQK